MKKLFAGFSICAMMAIAQPFTDYVWDHYQIGITVPDDCKVVKNTDHEFQMKSNDLDAYMYVFEKDITLDQMDEGVVEVANSLEMDDIEVAAEIEGDGLDGFYVEGTKDGHRAVLAGMIDPKSHTNFMLLITFLDKDMKATDDAVEIIQSVHSRK